jgi:hypothetical protein
MEHRLVSVLYKQQPERPTIDQLISPERLQPGDRFTLVFEGEIEFSDNSDDNVLDELFATFNSHGKPLPTGTCISRSLCVGDILVTCKEKVAFLVMPTGFERLPFVPDHDNFEITQTHSRELGQIMARCRLHKT